MACTRGGDESCARYDVIMSAGKRLVSVEGFFLLKRVIILSRYVFGEPKTGVRLNSLPLSTAVTHLILREWDTAVLGRTSASILLQTLCWPAHRDPMSVQYLKS